MLEISDLAKTTELVRSGKGTTPTFANFLKIYKHRNKLPSVAMNGLSAPLPELRHGPAADMLAFRVSSRNGTGRSCPFRVQQHRWYQSILLGNQLLTLDRRKIIWPLGNKIILIKTIVLPSSIGNNSGSQCALALELTHSNALSINTSLQHFPGTAEHGTEASPRPAKFLLAEPPQSSAQK